MKKKTLRRPQSAKSNLTCVLANKTFELSDDFVCQRSAGLRPQIVRGQRPILGLQLAINAPQTTVPDTIHQIEMNAENRKHTAEKCDQNVVLCGTTLTGSPKQEINHPTINYANIQTKNYAHVKSTIPKETGRRKVGQNVTKQITNRTVSKKESDGGMQESDRGTNGDVLTTETFVTQLRTDINKESEGQPDVGQTDIREDVILNLESLEETLDGVQNEIQKCLQKVKYNNHLSFYVLNRVGVLSTNSVNIKYYYQ